MAAISFDKLTKTYSKDGVDKTVINGIDLDIKQGEFVILVGPSGCGKSTVLRMVAGLEEISAGKMRFDDKVVNHKGPSERGIGMVFQSYALYPHMTIAENIAFPLRMSGVDKKSARAKVDEVAAMLEIANLLESKPGQLSGGQRQRVAIGRALVKKPSVFLLDEPLSNLDSALRGRMRRNLASYHRQLGCTVVYVTHDQREAMSLADRVVVLKDSFIEQHGSPAELYEAPATRFVAEFIGAPRMNFFDATVENLEGSVAGLMIGEHRVRAAVDVGVGDELAGRKVILGLRPENLAVVDANDPAANVVATVEQMEYMGGESLLFVNLEGVETQLVVKCGPRVQVKFGDRIGVSYDPYDAYLFDQNERAIPRGSR